MVKSRREQWKEMIARSFHPVEWFGETPGLSSSERSIDQEETMMWIYRQEPSGKFLVGFYDPERIWHLDLECNTRDEAAKRVHWLNGGFDEQDN